VRQSSSLTVLSAALLIAGALAAAPAFGHPHHPGGPDHPEHANPPHHPQPKQPQKRMPTTAHRAAGQKPQFTPRQRREVRQMFAKRFAHGHCPPGLAKKHDGCMPPGHAKRWILDRPLRPGIQTYRLPQPILHMLGPAPIGYRYVRVSADILLIATGTRMVVDAIQDIGGD